MDAGIATALTIYIGTIIGLCYYGGIKTAFYTTGCIGGGVLLSFLIYVFWVLMGLP